jgi:hypothetical protein
MARQFNVPHLYITLPTPTKYKAPKSQQRLTIPQRNRIEHVIKLREQFKKLDSSIENLLIERKKTGYEKIEGVLVTVKGTSKKDLVAKSLQDVKENVEVINCGENPAGEEFAIVRFSNGSTQSLIKKVEQYASKDRKSGIPANNNLVASIESISKAILEEFWVGNRENLPILNDSPIWWEVWLIGGTEDLDFAESMRNQFLNFATKENLRFNPDLRIDFPDRQVFLIETSSNQMAKAITYLDCIAELRPPSRGIRDWYTSKI